MVTIAPAAPSAFGVSVRNPAATQGAWLDRDRPPSYPVSAADSGLRAPHAHFAAAESSSNQAFPRGEALSGTPSEVRIRIALFRARRHFAAVKIEFEFEPSSRAAERAMGARAFELSPAALYVLHEAVRVAELEG